MYWLTGFPLINSLYLPRNNYGNLLKSKQTSIRNFTVNRDHINKSKDAKVVTHAPTDIVVGTFNPYSSVMLGIKH